MVELSIPVKISLRYVLITLFGISSFLVFSQDSNQLKKEIRNLRSQTDSLQAVINDQVESLNSLDSLKESIVRELKDHQLKEDFFQTALETQGGRFSTMVSNLATWFGILIAIILAAIALNIERRFNRFKNDYDTERNKLESTTINEISNSKNTVKNILKSERIKQNERLIQAEENVKALCVELQDSQKASMLENNKEVMGVLESELGSYHDTLKKVENQNQNLHGRLDNSNGNLFALFHQFYQDKKDWINAFISAVKAASSFSEFEQYESKLIFSNTEGNLRHARYYLRQIIDEENSEKIPYQAEIISDLKAIRFLARDNKDVISLCKKIELELQKKSNSK